MPRLRGIGLLAALAACDGVGDFLQARAEAVCARHARCGTLDAAGFADEAACLEALEAANRRASLAGQADCDRYDADAADSCLAAWADTPCDEPVDLAACDAVCAE